MSLSLNDAVNRFERRCRAKSLSPRTVQFYQHQFGALRRYLLAQDLPLDVEMLTTDVLRGYIALRRETSAHLAKQAFATLRVWFRFLVDEELLSANPMSRIEAPRLPKQLVKTFNPDDVQAVLEACPRDFIGLRDRAVIMVLIDCGLRATEICSLMLEHVDLDEQILQVTGKGSKTRMVPFGTATRQALKDYLCRRPTLPTSTVFVSEYAKPLVRKNLWWIVKSRCQQAEITGVRCSPHTFRHSFAVTYLRNGGDVFSLQKLLGHSDLAMTRRYAELSSHFRSVTSWASS